MTEQLDRLAQQALRLWGLPDCARASRLNVSENVTYLVRVNDRPHAALRVHRDGYHSRAAIRSELDWMAALERAGVVHPPKPILGRDGRCIQAAQAHGMDAPRFMVLFDFIEGHPPDPGRDLTGAFASLGEIAARMHLHAMAWARPPGFTRRAWDEIAVFGPRPVWGNWRAAPGVDPVIRAVLEVAERTVRARLQTFGKEPARFGLIHADMRLANLLVTGATTRVIDFDDCGFGWFLYDFAAAISFMETDPVIPALQAAWLQGYRRIRALPVQDEAEIDTFVLLRRMALLAWVGSRAGAPEPDALAPDFADGTAALAEGWLTRIKRGG